MQKLKIKSEPTLFNLRADDKDPISSHIAAEKAKKRAKSQAFKILSALKKFNGYVSKELSETTGLDRHNCARLLPHLRNQGYVQNCIHPCEHDPCQQGQNNYDCPLAMFKNYKRCKQIQWFVRDKQWT